MFISVVIVRGILSELRNRGIDPDELLQTNELSRERIGDIRAYVTFDELDRLVSYAIKRTNDPGLGLAVGANAPETMLQMFGHLMLAHKTIREAYASWQRYSALLTDAMKFQLLEQGARALFVCEPPRVMARTHFFVDLALAVTLRIGTHFARSLSDLHEVHLRHATPSYAERYGEVFGCPVRFGQEHNALIFARELLDRPHLHADETVRTVLNDAVERLLQERSQTRTLTDSIRAAISCAESLSRVDAAVIARRMGMSQRTLRRRLGAEGTTLATLIDEARCRVACEALGRADVSVKEIAELLNFSEPSAFHRAFKRWTGQTPAEYARITAAARRNGKATASRAG